MAENGENGHKTGAQAFRDFVDAQLKLHRRLVRGDASTDNALSLEYQVVNPLLEPIIGRLGLIRVVDDYGGFDYEISFDSAVIPGGDLCRISANSADEHVTVYGPGLGSKPISFDLEEGEERDRAIAEHSTAIYNMLGGLALLEENGDIRPVAVA